MRLFVLSIIAAILLLGCVSPEQTAPSNISQPANASVKEFNMTAKQWEFIPDTITVKKGDLVRINLTSEDVAHGFGLTEYGMNERVEGGESATVEFTADKAGNFTFFCSVFCGQGHSGMKGTLVVEDS